MTEARRIAGFWLGQMADELISIPEIAVLHARHKSVIHKLVSRLGIETHLIRRQESRGQKVAYIAQSDYQVLLDFMNSSTNSEIESDSQSAISGNFYLIQLEPDLDVGRFKVGFATDMNERLRAHRTSAPFASLVKKWPCKLLWEKTAIECVTSGCERLHTEVFRTSDLNAVVQRADSFFALMPNS